MMFLPEQIHKDVLNLGSDLEINVTTLKCGSMFMLVEFSGHVIFPVTMTWFAEQTVEWTSDAWLWHRQGNISLQDADGL